MTMKWLLRLWEIIKLCWAWRKKDRQEQQQAREQVEAQIQEIDHEVAGEKAQVDKKSGPDLDAQLDELCK